MRYAGLVLVVAVCGCDGGTGPGSGAVLELTPALPDTFFALGASLQLNAVLRDGSGRTVPGATVAFATSAATVATVSPSGVVTAAGNGSARITGSSASATAAVDVHVRQRLAAVAVQPAALTLVSGRTATLAAAAVDAGGHAIAGLPALTYSSSDPAVAGVDAAGVVTAFAAGTANVTVTVASPADGTRSGSVAVTVLVAPPLNATVGMSAAQFIPDVTEILAGGTVTWSNTSGVSHDVDFGTPAMRIAPFEAGQRSLSFPAAGTFDYHCNLHAGMTGRVIVR